MKIPSVITNYIEHIIEISKTNRIVNGNSLLIIYYIAVIAFLVFDIYFRRHIKRLMEDDRDLSENLLKFFKFYQKHGFILMTALLLLLCLGLTVYEEGFRFDFKLLIEIILSFSILSILMKLLLRVFVDEDGYSNILFMRCLHVICYMILGNYFVYLMPFVRYPNLFTAYVGLCVGLVFCVYVMIKAIFDPEILRRSKDGTRGISEAYGILKGMIAVVICILFLEFMMVYACYHSDPELYTVGTGTNMNGWNLFYYLIITFTTIGYGDIYPIVHDGIIYSQLTAIIIGLSSMFTTGCFVAAVISTANSIAQSTQNNKSSDNNSSDKK